MSSTIYSRLLAAIECGKLSPARERFFTAVAEKAIAAAFGQIPDGKLGDISALLGVKYDIGLLRIFRKLVAQIPQRPMPSAPASKHSSLPC